jgi:hypothetical protein
MKDRCLIVTAILFINATFFISHLFPISSTFPSTVCIFTQPLTLPLHSAQFRHCLNKFLEYLLQLHRDSRNATAATRQDTLLPHNQQ